MQLLEVSGAVRLIYRSLGVKRLKGAPFLCWSSRWPPENAWYNAEETSKLSLSLPLHVVCLIPGFSTYSKNAHQRCLRKGVEGGAAAGGRTGERLRGFVTCAERKNFENVEIKRHETSGISRDGRDDWGLREKLSDLGNDGRIILKCIWDTYRLSV